ncbi:hypothetical protein RRG08_056598 [Elysia crispata]|uniref:Uncharacterized protein n=1 Tax=Elysia crispata TaxID=231223 RepID=A0AAE1B4Y7_9GAST|nr:hypothetical protein RRG08_056598 [Elysia crispata]
MVSDKLSEMFSDKLSEMPQFTSRKQPWSPNNPSSFTPSLTSLVTCATRLETPARTTFSRLRPSEQFMNERSVFVGRRVSDSNFPAAVFVCVTAPRHHLGLRCLPSAGRRMTNPYSLPT